MPRYDVGNQGVFSVSITPVSAGGAALGTSALPWSDLFLAFGAGINFSNGDLTVLHSTGTLTLQSSGMIPVGIKSSHTTATGLGLNNTSSGGAEWRLYSNGSAATYGPAGSFTLRDATGNVNVLVALKTSGNIGILTTSPGGGTTSGAGVLSLANGTAPVGGVANQVSLFSEDVAASAELKVLDEAGNVTTLSPHPSDFLNTLPTAGREYPWAYDSSNAYLGKRITVDMMGAIRELERLSGKRFIVLTNLPPAERADWDTDQAAQWMRREEERTAAQNQIAKLDAQIAAEADPDKRADLIKERDSVVVPAPYTKKGPPQWMRGRGVVSSL